jgi:hypothetical protein
MVFGVGSLGVRAWRDRHECTDLVVRNDDKVTYRHVSIAVRDARLEVAEALPPNSEIQTRVCEGTHDKWFLDYLGPAGGLVGPKFLDSVSLDVPEKERVEIAFVDGEARALTCPAMSLVCGNLSENASRGRSKNRK